MALFMEHRLTLVLYVRLLFLFACFMKFRKAQLVRIVPFLSPPPPTLLPSGTCRLRLTDGFSKGTVGALSTHGKPCGHSSPERIPQAALSQAGYDNDVEQMLTAPVRLP